MKYEWEDEALSKVKNGLDLDIGLRFRVIGIAVENVETAEAALFPIMEMDGDILNADLFRDVSFDAERVYETSVKAMRARWRSR